MNITSTDSISVGKDYVAWTNQGIYGCHFPLTKDLTLGITLRLCPYLCKCTLGIVKGGRCRWMCITWSGQVCEVGERMSAPLGEGADGNGVNGLSNPPLTLTRQDLSLFRRNLNTIRRWAATSTRTRNRSSLSPLQTYLEHWGANKQNYVLYFYVYSSLLTTNYD